jgi:hypothetical protein
MEVVEMEIKRCERYEMKLWMDGGREREKPRSVGDGDSYTESRREWVDRGQRQVRVDQAEEVESQTKVTALGTAGINYVQEKLI